MTPTPASLAAGAELTLCVRPTVVQVAAPGSGRLPTENTTRGSVRQQAYMGDHQDLRIQLDRDILLRALAPTRELYAPGDEVLVHIPPDSCQIVSS